MTAFTLVIRIDLRIFKTVLKMLGYWMRLLSSTVSPQRIQVQLKVAQEHEMECRQSQIMLLAEEVVVLEVVVLAVAQLVEEGVEISRHQELRQVTTNQQEELTRAILNILPRHVSTDQRTITNIQLAILV